MDGDIDTEGLILGLIEEDGESDGLIEAEGDILAEGEILGLTDTDGL